MTDQAPSPDRQALLLSASAHLRRWVHIHTLAEATYQTLPAEVQSGIDQRSWEDWACHMAMALAASPVEIRRRTRSALDDLLATLEDEAAAAVPSKEHLSPEELQTLEKGVIAFLRMGPRSKRQVDLWLQAREAGTKAFLVLASTGRSTEARFTTEIPEDRLRQLGLDRAMRD